MNETVETVFLKKYDYVQFSGGYDSIWGSQWIKKIEKEK